MVKIKMPADKATNKAIAAPNTHASIAIDNATYMKTRYGWRLHNTREIRRILERAAKKARSNHG